MKTLIFTLALFLLSNLINAQTASYEWTAHMGGAYNEQGMSISTDDSGYVYITGIFSGTTDFDPGIGTYYITAMSTNSDMFIQKLNSLGELQWVKQIRGTSYEYPASITVDDSGYVYIAGYFNGTADFNPGIDSFKLSSLGYYSYESVFIQKLDAEGNFKWAKQFGGNYTNTYCSFITIDSSGNIYTTGRFYQTVDFDPGIDTFYLTSIGNGDAFIQKMDKEGNFIWAKQLASSYSASSYITSIIIDPNGNIYSTGYFYGNVDFDPGIGLFNLNTGTSNAFVQKLNASGNFLWVVQNGGSTNSAISNSITVDLNGNIYTTGYFHGTVDFDPGINAFNLTSFGSGDIFIQKLTSSGNLLWAKQLGGTQFESAISITIDSRNNIYTTGTFYGTADFDPGINTFNLVPQGYSDVFIQKLDTAGNFLWASNIGGTSVNTYSNSIAVSNLGEVYTTGNFNGKVDFDPGSDTAYITGNGYNDIFVHKLRQCYYTYSSITPITCSSYTSPSGKYTWTISGIYSDTISNSIGCDSVISIYLTINDTKSVLTETSCDSYVSPSGNYTWTSSGTYSDTIPNSIGCDSIITIDLTINYTPTSTINVTTCNSYLSPSGKHIWYYSGTYNDTLLNSAGCDIVITANVTIYEIETSVVQNGNVLIASKSNVQYQWVDCSKGYSHIDGETSQVFMATENGDYSVIITDSLCSDTSACFNITKVGLNDKTEPKVLKFYPNPTTEVLNIELDNIHETITINVMNSLGQLVATNEQYSTDFVQLSMPDEAGLYFVQVKTEKQMATLRVIKE